MVLEDMGYSVDMIEFVDLAHSPKNLMIRAKKTKRRSSKNRDGIKELLEKYSIRQELFELVERSGLFAE